jgi:adenylate kinase
MASGALVEDSLVCEAVRSRLQRDLRDRAVILDGFPRTRTQAEYLDGILSDLNLPGPTVLHLEVARERLLPRMTARRHCGKCGAIYNLITRPSARGKRCESDGSVLVHRADDTEATIRRRFTEFDLACAPLVEHYSEGNYYRVDGDRDPDAVSADLLCILGQSEARAAA